MSIARTTNNERNGTLITFFGEEVEFADSIQCFAEDKIKVFAAMRYEICHVNDPEFTKTIPPYFFIEQAKKDWEKVYNEITASGVPENFLALFQSTSKGEQEKLLHGQSLTTYQLGALLFASSKLGYTYSLYKGEKLPSGVDAKSLPLFLGVEPNKIIKRGATQLTDGQLKAVMEQRTAIIARILDKGDEWHCFFQTFRSMRGRESWQGGAATLTLYFG